MLRVIFDIKVQLRTYSDPQTGLLGPLRPARPKHKSTRTLKKGRTITTMQKSEAPREETDGEALTPQVCTGRWSKSDCVLMFAYVKIFGDVLR